MKKMILTGLSVLMLGGVCVPVYATDDPGTVRPGKATVATDDPGTVRPEN